MIIGYGVALLAYVACDRREDHGVRHRRFAVQQTIRFAHCRLDVHTEYQFKVMSEKNYVQN